MKSELISAERDKFLESKEGKGLCSGTAYGPYLRNRIERAFLVGSEAGERIQKVQSRGRDDKCCCPERDGCYFLVGGRCTAD